MSNRDYIENPRGHVWKKDDDAPDAEVDIFGYSAGPHCNGPICVNCGYGFCHHCGPCKRECTAAKTVTQP